MELIRVRDCTDIDDSNSIPVQALLKKEPRCKICRSKWVWAINRMLLKGSPYKEVVERYKDRIDNLNIQNVSTHYLKHCNPRAFAMRTLKRREWETKKKLKNMPRNLKKLYEQKASEYVHEFIDEKVGLDVLIRDSFKRVEAINEDIEEKEEMIKFLNRSLDEEDIKILGQERNSRAGLIELRERVISNLITALEKKSKIGQPDTVINYNTLIIDMKGFVDDVISILYDTIPENHELKKQLIMAITGRLDRRFGKIIQEVPETVKAEVIK